MTVTIPSYKNCKYSEVWEIIEWRDGCIYKCRNTGYYIEANLNKNPLNPERYTLAPISTSLLQNDTVTIELKSAEDFD